MPWTVIRYDENGWPSHPDEDLPPDGATVEMWRPGGDPGWFFARGLCHRVILDVNGEHRSAQIANTTHSGVQYPPPDMPIDVQPGGVVWRLM